MGTDEERLCKGTSKLRGGGVCDPKPLSFPTCVVTVAALLQGGRKRYRWVIAPVRRERKRGGRRKGKPRPPGKTRHRVRPPILPKC
eukprot:1057667-Amphidinium_carterae.1